MGFGGIRNIYGDRIGLIAKLVITSKSGETQIIDTDEEWKCSTGAVTTSEIYDGEICDLRKHQNGWESSGFKDGEWAHVEALPLPQADLVSPDGPPIRRIQEVSAVDLITTPSGKKVLDFGQNLVGWLRVNLPAAEGVIISLQHVEVMDYGEIATRPLRSAKATDTITLSNKRHTWEPKCTFHGFRYVQVNDFPGKINTSDFTAIVVHSDMEQTGWFECSHPLINKLHRK
jgi:alpha-L-rhamnosidase